MQVDTVIDQRTVVAGRVHDLVPLGSLVIGLSLLSHLLAGDLAIPILGGERLEYVLAFAVICGLFYPIAVVVPPILKRVVQGRSREEIPPPWEGKGWSPLLGAAVILLTLYGVTSTGNLTEIYRVGVVTWHDAALWKLEYPIFAALHNSWLDRPLLWDVVYFQMWTFVLMAAVSTHSFDGLRRYAIFGMTILFAFYLTRVINLAFPTAGPAFFQPDWFALDGTATQTTQDALREFMAGQRPANGIYPATMAMPSLHVGLTAIAAAFLAYRRTWTLYFSVPWLLLVWTSTVILGWHYLLDGLGGLGVAGIAIYMAYAVQNHWDRFAKHLLGERMPLVPSSNPTDS